MSLTNFGEQFVRNVLSKFYSSAITPVIANVDYEGQIKTFGDTVNILMFLEDIELNDYTVGTDMTTQSPVDTEAQLHINRKKYYNFDIDRVDKQFTYVTDQDSSLIENAAKMLEKAIDTDLLSNVEEAAAGNRVGGKHWALVVGDTGTYVTITTHASHGIATMTNAACTGRNSKTGVDGEFAHFPVDCAGRGIRFCSSAINTPWFRIKTRVSSTVINFTNWDGSLVGDDQQGGTGVAVVKYLFRDGGTIYGGTCVAGYGCQIEGMRATQVTKTNVYALFCGAATVLDEYDVPQENRHISVPPWLKNTLVQAADLTPDIAMYHEAVVLNGKVGRVAGFDVHMVSGDRFSQLIEPLTCYAPTEAGVAQVTYVGTKILANHTGFITFAHSFTESRVVDAQLQFANLYQGLNLYGFKVLPMRRKCGAYIYGYK